MKIRIKEQFDTIIPEYGVLITSDTFKKPALTLFHDDKDAAFEFYNDAEILGSDVFKTWDPEIITKRYGFEADSNGKCYYVAHTSEGDEYLQEVRVVNQEPIYIP